MALGSVQVGLMVLVVPLRFSLPSVCGPEVPEVNLPPKKLSSTCSFDGSLKKERSHCQGDFTDRPEVKYINYCDFFFSTRSCHDPNVYIFR